MWKKILAGLGVVLLLIAAAAVWLWSLIDSSQAETDLSTSKAAQIAYLQQPLALAGQAGVKPRGKVLAVVTSTAFYPPEVVEGKTKKTGYELTELSRFYWLLLANGFAVDIASPLGGDAPRVLDDDDMAEFDYAFLNDATAMAKARNTIKLADVNPADYQAIYFVGGKGAMFDFPQDPDIARLVQAMTAQQKLVLAVCHGPAALALLTNADGAPWLAGKKVTSFTNAEELLLMPDAVKRFPFLLQSKLEQQGALFAEGPRYLPNLVIDGQLITGQNPWSVWQLAEATVRALGVEPRSRPATAEERTMQLLLTYQQLGLEHASRQVPEVLKDGPVQRNLVVMMALVAAMAGEWSDIFPLLQLTSEIKAAQLKVQLRVTNDANLGTSTDNLANTQAQMAALLQQEQLTGVVWSTVTPAGISTGAAGIADSEQQTVMRPDHKVQVGSIAKTLIAVGILRLVSEGKLSLDSPLSSVLPEIALDNLWASEQPVLLRHLLDHTSGLDDARLWQVFSLRATPDSPLRQAFKPGAAMRLRSKPGSRLSYSNMGYTLLGMVIEKVSGEHYEQYLDTHLLQPLQMFDSSFGFVTQLGTTADPRLAMGHFEDNVTQKAVPMFLRPAGQFTTTAADMALLARFLLSDGVIHQDINNDVNNDVKKETHDASNGKPFIAAELLRAMGQPMTTEAAQAGLEAGYALGLNSRDRHGVIGRCHVGTTFGFRANFCLFPEVKKAFFVAMNADVETANYDQFDALLVQELGLARPAQLPTPTAGLPQDIAEWLGFYQLAPSRMESFRYLDLLLNFATLQLAEPQLHKPQHGPQLQLTPFQGAVRLLTPVGGHLFQANDRIAASHVLLMAADQLRLISDGFRSYQQVSLWRLLPLWFSALAGVTGLGVVLIAGFMRFFVKSSRRRCWQPKDPLFPPFVAVIALLLPLPLFFGQSFLQLGELTVASAALALVTGLLPLAMLWGIRRSLLQARASGNAAFKNNFPELLVMTAVLQWSLVLVYWDLLPLRLWA